HRKIVAFPGAQFAGELADDSSPLTLGHFVLADPEAPGERHSNLILARTTFRLIRRAAHDEVAAWAPAESDPGDIPLLAAFRTLEGARAREITRDTMVAHLVIISDHSGREKERSPDTAPGSNHPAPQGPLCFCSTARAGSLTSYGIDTQK